MKKLIITIMTATIAFCGGEIENDKLRDLHGLWLKNRVKATQPLDEKYIELLEKLKMELMQISDLKGAVEVSAEIDKINEIIKSEAFQVTQLNEDITETKKKLSDFESKEEFAEWLIGSEWRLADDSRNYYKFDKDKKHLMAIPYEITKGSVNFHKYEVHDIGVVKFYWLSGRSNMMVLSNNLRTFNMDTVNNNYFSKYNHRKK